MIGNKLRDVNKMLLYAAHAFDDCWKLSLNITYYIVALKPERKEETLFYR